MTSDKCSELYSKIKCNEIHHIRVAVTFNRDASAISGMVLSIASAFDEGDNRVSGVKWLPRFGMASHMPKEWESKDTKYNTDYKLRTEIRVVRHLKH